MARGGFFFGFLFGCRVSRIDPGGVRHFSSRKARKTRVEVEVEVSKWRWRSTITTEHFDYSFSFDPSLDDGTRDESSNMNHES
jgi:hypothetical protein